MTAPNMETIAASLERSLQNCSLNNHNHNHHHHNHSNSGGGSVTVDGEGQGSSVTDGVLAATGMQGRSSSSTSSTSDAALELNSHVSLPYHWEQCLDLKTGEIYYINWRNGMKAKEDPKTGGEYSGDFYYSEEDENSSYDSEESSTESSPSSCRYEQHQQPVENLNSNNNNNNVLVVAGCKACLMYFMVPKQLEDCPKCSGQLLHFDRSENGSP
ncbi:hypothetical protein ACFX13_021836 [Malus domestica]|uniref:WW domain-containing protein n=1 Tax=Malus domestica TaxID=3750 RepID=A0A498HS25_MALDO|nr:uncharacterized protein LOC114822198 [Malus domestica]RXH71653.1 hypothetical protein DVH24_025154 [Malus domestica]